MVGYFLRRFFTLIPTLFILVALTFFLIRFAPGGPFDRETIVAPEVVANLQAKYRLDDPLPKQFLNYLSGLMVGDFGPSFQYKDRSVSELIAAGLPVSAWVGSLALFLAVAVGVPFGLWAAGRQNSWVDQFLRALSLSGLVLPSFVVAPLLTLVFGLILGWLPIGGWGSWQQMILPVLALALPQWAIITRMVRASALELLKLDFVRTAQAKGLTNNQILLRHVLPVSLTPLIAYLGPATAGLVTGSVVVEKIFSIPGIGRYFIQGAINRDYSLVMGITLVYGVILVLANLVSDLALMINDPRQRKE